MLRNDFFQGILIHPLIYGLPMRHAISISIGSSKRDKAVKIQLLGETVQIERIGTDGDTKKASQMYADLDGKVDAFGVGGADLGFMVEKKFYPMYSVFKMTRHVKITPLVDGNGLKNTLERKVRDVIESELSDYIGVKRVFIMAGIDRWGVTRSFVDMGYDCVFGDLIFGLGLPFPIRTEKKLRTLAKILMPIVGHFPFNWLYPTGAKQEERKPKAEAIFNWATVLAGDCKYITRYAPDALPGKVIVTNTTTEDDRMLFKKMGAKYLITTTPVLEGRSFGTNMMEAAILAALGRKEPVDYAHADEYLKLMDQLVQEINFKPQVQEL
jgi:hypothetical protein